MPKFIYAILNPSFSQKNKEVWRNYYDFIYDIGGNNYRGYEYCGSYHEFGQVIVEYSIYPCWLD